MSGLPLNIVLIGRTGQLAGELQRSLSGLGSLRVLGRPEIDLLQPSSVGEAIQQLTPDIVVNAAAYTAVDRAEAEPEVAATVNAEAPRVMAEAAKRVNALFITYSTDYVFDGNKTSPYTESDPGNPLNVYGATKLAGDRAVGNVGGEYLVFRTSWVYAPRGKNFLLTIMKLATERKELKVVDDQIGAPTLSEDIASATRRIIEQFVDAAGRRRPLGERHGIYNMTAQGSVSWCGFARAIIDEMRRRRMKEDRFADIVPISTREFPSVAVRPRNSVLSNQKIYAAFGITLPEWKASMVKTMAAVETSWVAGING